eukprot:gnl/TRDRNA2_/TRDRNA2_49520_c0_seq1.p1 gnl/TRDRNA2_/TRDRNA2_49520_c0~~gnl/TRDRNA2_/TRDRNA2_49520_c0_seq1.p1  ORF type:complete len:100 (+),score=1.06 gnl/TRDRNA2_/TRDRNA2_49520_c0_seq1:31-330(+)
MRAVWFPFIRAVLDQVQHSSTLARHEPKPVSHCSPRVLLFQVATGVCIICICACEEAVAMRWSAGASERSARRSVADSQMLPCVAKQPFPREPVTYTAI